MVENPKAIEVIKAVTPWPMYLHLFEAHVATVLDLWHDDTPHAPWESVASHAAPVTASAAAGGGGGEAAAEDTKDVHILTTFRPTHADFDGAHVAIDVDVITARQGLKVLVFDGRSCL